MVVAGDGALSLSGSGSSDSTSKDVCVCGERKKEEGPTDPVELDGMEGCWRKPLHEWVNRTC